MSLLLIFIDIDVLSVDDIVVASTGPAGTTMRLTLPVQPGVNGVNHVG